MLSLRASNDSSRDTPLVEEANESPKEEAREDAREEAGVTALKAEGAEVPVFSFCASILSVRCS